MTPPIYPDSQTAGLEALTVVDLRIEDMNFPADQRALLSGTLGGAHTHALDADKRVRANHAQIATARDAKNRLANRLVSHRTIELQCRKCSAELNVIYAAFNGENPSDVTKQPHDDQITDSDKLFIKVDVRADLDLPSLWVQEVHVCHIELKDAQRAVRDLLSERTLASTTAKANLVVVKPHRAPVRRVLAIHGAEAAMAPLLRYTR